MATFSAGWHSYNFKSMLRSRFGSKDGQPSRPPQPSTPPNASFHEGVATKDVSINDETGLTARIFLPACCIQPGKINEFGWMMKRMGTSQEWLPRLLSPDKKSSASPSPANSSPGGPGSTSSSSSVQPLSLESVASAERSLDGSGSAESSNEQFWQGVNGHASATAPEGSEGGEAGTGAADAGAGAEKETEPARREYTGYMPKRDAPNNHRLPVIVQFHAGGFVTGNKDSPCNDIFCRRLARVCNAMVIAVGYRLAPEHQCPAAYDDGYEVLKWLSRQAILADVENDISQHQQAKEQAKQAAAGPEVDELERVGSRASNGSARGGLDEAGATGPKRRSDEDSMDGNSGSMGMGLGLLQDVADPWIAIHADVSRCLLLGPSSGANIADQVARRACTAQGVNDLSPLVLAGQVLLYPLFSGSMRTPSESKSKDAYFFDVPTCELVFRLFLGPEEFSLDHPAANPMLREQLPPGMPPTLLVVADHDILTDRAIAYSVFLRNYGVDVQVNSYKDVVHGFASYVSMVQTPQAEACVEDIAMWVAKHVTGRNEPASELSY